MSFQKNSNLLPQICAVHFATVGQVHGYLLGQEDPNAVFPVLKEVWRQLYFTKSTEDFRENQKPSPNGSIYQYQLTLRYPGFKPADPHAFAALDQHKWILLLEFETGEVRLIGSTEQGCDFSWGFSTAAKGFQLQWNLQDSEPARNYEHHIQFFVDPDQHLIQAFPDANTYTLNADKHLVMTGPQSPYYKYEEGNLVKPDS